MEKRTSDCFGWLRRSQGRRRKSKTMSDAIVLEHVNMSFKRLALSGRTTLKEAVLKGQLFRMGRSNGYFEALKDISFSVPHGTVLGLVGCNGAGKSTLLRILADIYRPTSGKVKINGRVS